jgi:hypothetical protein
MTQGPGANLFPLSVDPLMLELSPRFRRWSSSVASPVGSVYCIPQSRVEYARHRSAAFLAADQSHQRDHQFGSSNFLISAQQLAEIFGRHSVILLLGSTSARQLVNRSLELRSPVESGHGFPPSRLTSLNVREKCGVPVMSPLGRRRSATRPTGPQGTPGALPTTDAS